MSRDIKYDKKMDKRKKFLLELMGDPLYKPMRQKEIAILLQVSGEEREELGRLLEELLYEGRAVIDNKGRYRKYQSRADRKDERRREDMRREDGRAADGRRKDADSGKRAEHGGYKEKGKKNRKADYANALEGVFVGHPKGFGFVEIEGEEEDIFISPDDTGTALHKDRVKVVLTGESREGRRREGKIVEIVERGMTEVVGTYDSSGEYGFVLSDNPKFSKDLFIAGRHSMNAKHGDKVVAVITDYGEHRKSPEGKITEVLGGKNTPGSDILAIVKGFGIPSSFPEKVRAQADRVPDHVLDADRDGRMDLTHLMTVTIDGEDAKDLDDAISLTKEDGIYHLGVHIADVSNYVQGGSALDREALKRGTSVYLADRVIPMLPERLSNGICSLNMGQDRLALSCLMDVNEDGVVIRHKIAETVINVDERMSYTVVKNILEGTDPEADERYQAQKPMFFLMKELSLLLREKRHNRGSIDFDFPESKIILNEAGRCIDIKPYETNVATRIIEDFMLLANETVAEEYCQGEYPFVYRTHENPDPAKVESLLTMIHNQGVTVRKAKEEISPKEIQEILAEIEGMPNEPMITRMALRTMKQAKYTTECIGHFGLAAKYYCHFTSPIRRYPDLQIHRIIKDNLRGRLERVGKTEHYREILDEVARQSSVCERRADEAERESDKLKKAEYMSWHIGESFEGIISGVTNWGFYVELPNTVEGLVHVSSLRDDYYQFLQETLELRGDMTGKSYKMGQKVKVRVESADPVTKTIDFIVEHDKF